MAGVSQWLVDVGACGQHVSALDGGVVERLAYAVAYYYVVTIVVIVVIVVFSEMCGKWAWYTTVVAYDVFIMG